MPVFKTSHCDVLKRRMCARLNLFRQKISVKTVVFHVFLLFLCFNPRVLICCFVLTVKQRYELKKNIEVVLKMFKLKNAKNYIQA